MVVTSALALAVVVGAGALLAVPRSVNQTREQAAGVTSRVVNDGSPSDTTVITNDNGDTSPVDQSAPARPSVAAAPKGNNTSSSPGVVTPSTGGAMPPASRPLGVTSVWLDQPAVFCSGGGDYYIAQIGDVMISLNGGASAELSYGFEVTGGIADTWNGYRHKAAVATGLYSTSFNALYWGSNRDPQMAYSEVVGPGHGAAAIRAVVYTPNLVYSPWVNVPAQGFGEKCV